VICDPSNFENPDIKDIRLDLTGVHPMKAWFEIITTPTADTPGTVVGLHFPDKRYLFGQLAEGTQRACTERSHKLASIGDIFVTGRTEWANTGGMIGVILTQADALKSSNEALEEENKKKAERKAAGMQAKNKNKPSDGTSDMRKQNVTVHGATNLMHTMATARRFVFRTGMPIYMKEYDSASIAKQISFDKEDPFETPTFIDSNIKVWALPLKPQPTDTQRVTRSQSPRKRSLDEFQETEQQSDETANNQMLRQSIVSDMFDSDWKMDALIETPLAEVKMPAALFVRNAETKDIEPYKGPLPGDDSPLPDIKVLVRKPWPGATVTSLPPTSPSKEAVSYIIRSHDIRGKFEAAKAKSLGVPTGPDFARLAKGETIQTPEGNTVTPDMVLGAVRRGKGLAVIDLPSPEYVEDLVNRPEWNSPSVTTELKVFIWILGPGVGDHPKLREFVARMSHVKHTVSSVDYCPNYLAFNSAAGAAVRLARLRGENYPIPVHDNVTVPQVQSGARPGSISLEDSPFEPLQPGLIIDMEPQFGFNKSDVVAPLNTAKTIFQIPRSVEKRMEVIRTRVKKPDFQRQLAEMRKDLPGAEAEIIALGTGSSSPSKYRNVSATLLHVPGYGYYLLDCGENTLGQINRVFGYDKTREILQNLRMIWISHLHADHHLGTASLIRAWYQENYGAESKSTEPATDLTKILQEKRLAVVSEEMMIAWLEEYAAVEDFGFDKLIPLCAHSDPAGPSITTKFSYRQPRGGNAPYGIHSTGRTILDFKDNSSPLTPLLKSALGLEDILTTRVKHCKGALALSIVFPDGFKVSYSGDCRPSDKFASIGRDSTVLIHEATFHNDMVGSALAKRHSTAAEALEVARRMGARTIFLTHFSQRYQKIASIDQNAGTNKHDAVRSSGPTEKVLAKEPADPDIPLDDPEEQPASVQSAGYLLDDIRFPLPNRPGLPRRDLIPGVNAPIAAAMDYMRVKVGDLALAQAYAPAVERLVELLERDANQQSEITKKAIREAEEARKAKKNKKFGSKKAAAGAAAAGVAALAAETEEKEAETELPAHSVWSASESEAGWETSDYEE
jgi:ribonuclease Z